MLSGRLTPRSTEGSKTAGQSRIDAFGVLSSTVIPLLAVTALVRVRKFIGPMTRESLTGVIDELLESAIVGDAGAG